MSLKWRTFITFITIFMASLMVTFGFIFYSVSDDLEKLATDSARHEIVSMTKNLESHLNGMKKTFYTTSFNKLIIRELQKPAGEANYQAILDTMEEIVYFSDNIYSIYLQDVKTGNVLTTETMSANGRGYQWFRQYMPEEQKELTLIDTVDITSHYNKMYSYFGEVKVDFFGETVAYLSVNVLQHDLQKLIMEDQVYDGSVQFIMDKNGSILAKSNNFLKEMGQAVNLKTEENSFVECNGTKYFYLDGTTEQMAKYVKLIPKSEMFSSIYKVGAICVGAFVIFAICILFAVHKLLNYIIAPIYELSEKIRNYRQKEKVHVEFKTERTDEFAYLFKSLENMTNHIDYLIDELYKKDLYKKEMQLKLYRSSINPHFIFNLLDSIIWTLKFKDYKKAEKTLTDFSKFFRYSLAQNKDKVTVEEMKQWVVAYGHLESFLKDDSIEVSVDIPEELYEIEMPSLLVQPIVENSFKYAFKGRECGKISVQVIKDGDILKFFIKDDGIGMRPEELEELWKHIKDYDIHSTTKHFGLASVYQRLALLEENPCFYIESEVEKGTSIYFETKV